MLVGVDLGRHICQISIHKNGVRSVFLRKTDLTPRDVPTDCGQLSKAGWVRLRGREPHGCGDRAYMDVLAASRSTGPTAPSHRSPAFDVAPAVAVAPAAAGAGCNPAKQTPDRKSTRLNSSHSQISYAVFCL